MYLEGKLSPPRGKRNRYWSVELPLVEIYSQGKTEEEAYSMITDAVESLVNRSDFQATIVRHGRNRFYISSQNHALFLAFILSRLRGVHKLTSRELAKRLSSKSPNSFGRYEQGKAVPRIDTLDQLLSAIDPRLGLVLKKAG